MALLLSKPRTAIYSGSLELQHRKSKRVRGAFRHLAYPLSLFATNRSERKIGKTGSETSSLGLSLSRILFHVKRLSILHPGLPHVPDISNIHTSTCCYRRLCGVERNH